MTSGGYFMTGEHARWSVLWIQAKGKRKVIREHDCVNDLTEALRVYLLVKKAERPMATLRCNNVGFPPPLKFRPKEVKLKQKRVNGKGKVEVTKIVMPMVAVNDAGYTWCPYCREFRRFEKVTTKKQKVEGTYHNQQVTWVMPRTEEADYRCPMCSIGTSNPHVQRYNPGLVRVAKRTRTTKGKNGRTRRNSRS